MERLEELIHTKITKNTNGAFYVFEKIKNSEHLALLEYYFDGDRFVWVDIGIVGNFGMTPKDIRDNVEMILVDYKDQYLTDDGDFVFHTPNRKKGYEDVFYLVVASNEELHFGNIF